MAEYDDGAYYEVQLNNKQLVFFFMATLAIAVVVFLCGVMVGRGVHDATLAAAQNDIAATSPKPFCLARPTVLTVILGERLLMACSPREPAETTSRSRPHR